YMKEEQRSDSADSFLGYYSLARDGILFSHIGGKAADHLPGLNRELGITKSQHHDLHHGKWNGERLVHGGHRPVWQRDAEGKIITEKNPKTGRWQKVPVMVD